MVFGGDEPVGGAAFAGDVAVYLFKKKRVVRVGFLVFGWEKKLKEKKREVGGRGKDIWG